MTTVDAILLAGGRSSRMAGPDKVMLKLAGRRLLERAIDAVHAAGCAHIAVVGPERDLNMAGTVSFDVIREDPPFSGPVAGLLAARDLGESDWVLLLATDVPRVAEVVDFLVQAINSHPLVDAHLIEAPDGHLEWLCSAIRREVLAEKLAALPHLSVGVRRLFDDIDFMRHFDCEGMTDDVDTPESWDRARDSWSNNL